MLLHFFHAGGRHDLHAGGNGAQVEFDFALVQCTLAQHLAEFLARLLITRAGLGVGGESHHLRVGQQRIEQAFLGRIRRAIAHLGDLFVARHLHGDFGQVLDDGIHLAAYVAHLGELGGFHLHERRFREPREPARDLGLAAAGGADHENVLRGDLLAQRVFDLHAAPAIAQRDGDRALGGALADDVFVEFGNDFARGHFSSSITRLRFV